MASAASPANWMVGVRIVSLLPSATEIHAVVSERLAAGEDLYRLP